jgi:high-affinity nickel permease
MKYHITPCDFSLYGLWFRTAVQMLLLIVSAVTVCKRVLAVVTAVTIFPIVAP